MSDKPVELKEEIESPQVESSKEPVSDESETSQECSNISPESKPLEVRLSDLETIHGQPLNSIIIEEPLKRVKKHVPAGKRDKLPRRRKLTAKQANYVSALLEGRTPTDSVLIAGYDVGSRQGASEMSSQLLNNTHVRSTLSSLISNGKYDIRFESMWERILDDQLDDSKSVGERMQGRNTQLKALEQIARIGGLIAPTRSETRTLNVTTVLPPRKESK